MFASSISAIPPPAEGTVRLVIVAFVTVSLATVSWLVTWKLVAIPLKMLALFTYSVPT